MAIADRRMPRLKAVLRRGAVCDACLRSVERREAISLPELGCTSVFACPVSSTRRDRDQSPRAFGRSYGVLQPSHVPSTGGRSIGREAPASVGHVFMAGTAVECAT